MTILAPDVAARLGLGTVQFGLDYGATNSDGQVSESDAKKIVERASSAGLALLDTAALYGNSEEVLGRIGTDKMAIRIVTKTPAVQGEIVTPDHLQAFEDALGQSLKRLKRDRVYGLLVHHGADLLKPGGERLVDFLHEMKSTGRAEKIGVSVYSSREIDALPARFTPDIVQLPINLADQRLIETGHLQRLKDRGVEIHARSIFLQGILLQDADHLPPFFAPARKDFEMIGRRILEQGLSPLEACLGFALGRSEIDAIIVGATKLDELNGIIEAASRVSRMGLDVDALGHGLTNEQFLDPSQWRLDS